MAEDSTGEDGGEVLTPRSARDRRVRKAERLHNTALTLAAGHGFTEALRSVSLSIDLRPTHLPSILLAAALALKLRQPQLAIDHASKALTLHPESVRGLQYYTSGVSMLLCDTVIEGPVRKEMQRRSLSAVDKACALEPNNHCVAYLAGLEHGKV
eukprot:Sspe_Gene.86722::Locus_57467_Transcript_1_1_Confidence_1.000_Length_514::g.86722::m.86722